MHEMDIEWKGKGGMGRCRALAISIEKSCTQMSGRWPVTNESHPLVMSPKTLREKKYMLVDIEQHLFITCIDKARYPIHHTLIHVCMRIPEALPVPIPRDFLLPGGVEGNAHRIPLHPPSRVEVRAHRGRGAGCGRRPGKSSPLRARLQ